MRFYCDFAVRDANKLLAGLVLFELCLVSIFAVHKLLGSPIEIISSSFNPASEGNIPAWFSSVQLFLIGLPFLLKSWQLDPDYLPSPRFLRMVAVGFVFLSADEAASIHEGLTRLLKPVEWVPRFKGDHGIWVFIYLPIGLILFLATFRQLAALWHRYRHATFMMAIGMGIFLLGAVGLEIIGYQFLRSGWTPVLYKASVVLEEFLEMSGASIILYGAILLLLPESGVAGVPPEAR